MSGTRFRAKGSREERKRSSESAQEEVRRLESECRLSQCISLALRRRLESECGLSLARFFSAPEIEKARGDDSESGAPVACRVSPESRHRADGTLAL